MASLACQLPPAASADPPSSAGGEAADWTEEGPLPPAMTAFFEFFAPMWVTGRYLGECGTTIRQRRWLIHYCETAPLICDRSIILRSRAEEVRDESAAANAEVGWRDGARGLVRAVEGIQGECSTSDHLTLPWRLRETKNAFHALAEHWRTTHRPAPR